MENQLYIAFKENKLFTDISLDNLELDEVKGRLISLKEGEILFREGDPSDAVYLVVSGEVNLIKKKLLGASKAFVFGENDFFGYDEIADDIARTSTAVALRDTYLIALSQFEIDKIIEQNHMVKTNLLNYSDIISRLESAQKEKAVEEDVHEVDNETTENDAGDVAPFEQSLKDDLIDKHDSSIEEDSSVYEEELKEEKYEKIHDEELPEEKARHTIQQEENEEPLFPDEDVEVKSEKDIDQSEHIKKQDETGTTDETGSYGDETSLDDTVVSAIESTDQPEHFEENTTEEDEAGEEKKKEGLSDFDEDFYAAFSKMNENDDEENESIDNIGEEERSSLTEDNDVERESDFDETEEEKDGSFESEEEKELTGENMEDTEEEIETPEEKFETVDEEFKEKDEESGEGDVAQISQEDSLNEEETISEPTTAIEGDIITEESRNDYEEVDKDKNESDESGMLTSEYLRKIIKASQLVNSNIKIDEVLNNIVTVATDLTDADRGTLYLIDKEKNELWSKVATGDEMKEIHLEMGEGLAGWVAQNRELVNIEDASQDERFKADYDRSTGYQTKSVLCFPIKNREDEIVGVLQLLNSKKGKFTELDEEFLGAISIQCALALQNAELVEKLLETERVTSLGKMTNFLIQDIKKPVLVSKRYAEHVKTKDLPNDAAQIIDMILDQLSQVADLVQTTSNYSEGKAVFRTSRTNLNETLQDYSDRLDSYVRTRNCEIINQFDKDAKVNIDSKEMFQVYNHIIRNACDAMPEGGRIFVSTKIEGDSVKLLFKDEGIGIPESIVDKLFEPFMTHGKKDGTGLGLTIAKKIVEGHNGSIKVESMLGEGCTFIIQLPVSSPF